jgi:hypothetical protein
MSRTPNHDRDRYAAAADQLTAAELFPAEETPFNLAGELLDNSTTAEGEARVRALAESEARKAQTQIEFVPREVATPRANCYKGRYAIKQGDRVTYAGPEGISTGVADKRCNNEQQPN